MPRTTIDDLLRRARSGLERLAPDQALEAQRAGALIVDVRSNDDRLRDGIIPGSLHVPRTVLEWRLDPDSPYRNPHACDLGRQVVVVCADGFSSSLAAATLQELGFARATDLDGGFTAWRTQGMPVTAAPPPEEGLPGMGTPCQG
jgi:rhodanese-related sulfurtransferase